MLSKENIQRLEEAKRVAAKRTVSKHLKANLENFLFNDNLFPNTANIIRKVFIQYNKKLSPDFYDDCAEKIIKEGAYDGIEYL